jgi:hypothetical protein
MTPWRVNAILSDLLSCNALEVAKWTSFRRKRNNDRRLELDLASPGKGNACPFSISTSCPFSTLSGARSAVIPLTAACFCSSTSGFR